jgi:hypothetical protein
MMIRTFHKTIGIALIVLGLGVPGVRAQQQGQDQQQPADQQQPPNQSSAPVPAYHSPLAGVAGNGDVDSNTQQLSPDTRPLAGVQDLSLGAPITRSYWQPHIDFSGTADSNALETPTGSSWGGWISLSGGIDVHRTSGNSDLTVSYTSGGMFAIDSVASNGLVQGLAVTDKYSFHRTTLTFIDQLTYLPEASTGFAGLGGVPLPGGGSTGLGSVFTPGQTVLTGRDQNLGNTFVTEVDTSLTHRTSLTFAGGYVLLHYFDAELLDYNDAIFRAGYNYQLTRKSTLAVLYTFSGYRYSDFDQSINSNTVQLSYGLRVTGKWAFQIAVGPQFTSSHSPITSTTGSTGGESGTGTNSISEVYWALNTSLLWQGERTGAGLSYNHGVGGGSGVLAGSLTDNVTGSVTRQVSRTFSSDISGGYSRNQGVAIGGPVPINQTYDYWFGGASITRPFGRSLGLTLSYQLQYQISNSAVCVGLTCGTNIVRNLVSVGVGWHSRPLLF